MLNPLLFAKVPSAVATTLAYSTESEWTEILNGRVLEQMVLAGIPDAPAALAQCKAVPQYLSIVTVVVITPAALGESHCPLGISI